MSGVHDIEPGQLWQYFRRIDTETVYDYTIIVIKLRENDGVFGQIVHDKSSRGFNVNFWRQIWPFSLGNRDYPDDQKYWKRLQ